MANRKQHVVPYFYLKNFFPGLVYRKGEQSPRFTKKPGNVSVRKYYYGKSSDDLILPLDKMNSVIENEAAPVLRRLMENVTTINQRDWITLSYFFANMQIRNPYYHESLRQTFRQMTDQVNEMAERMKDAYEKAKAEGKDFHLPEAPKSDSERGYSLEEVNKSMEELEATDGTLKITQLLYYQIRKIAEYIQKMSLHVIEPPGALFFITADTPLVLFSFSSGTTLGAGWGNKDAFAMIPVHPKRCMMLAYRREPSIYSSVLTPENVHLWNIEMMKYASHEIYSKHPYDMALDWMHQQRIWRKRE